MNVDKQCTWVSSCGTRTGGESGGEEDIKTGTKAGFGK